MLPFIIFQFHLILVCVSSSERGKRLLLNDPDYAARVNQLESTVQTLVSEMTSLKSALKSRTQNGAVYIRWGRKTCPQHNGTELLYSGTIGGGWFSRTSSPAEALCLPHDPDFVTKDSATTDFHWVSSLYGAEYHSGTGPYNHDVPCVVCRATLSEYHSGTGPYNHDVPCAVCRATLSEYQSGTGPYNHDVPCAVCRATLSEYHSGTGPYNHDVPCAVCRATLSEYHSGTGPYNHDVPCAVCRATLSEYHSGTGPYNHDVPCAVCRATLSEYHSGTGPYNHDVPCAVCRATLSEYHSGTGPYNHDVPCAVCRATLCSSVIMIPGKTSCYSGWKTEYFGRMSASSNYHKASSQYTCIDENPDVLEAGGADNLINPVRAVCGSLRCPPFYDNALLTCVVCSS